MRGTLLAAAIMLWATAPAAAATLDVCPSTCTYATIGDAAAGALTGDEIEVAAGTYAECFVVLPAGVSISGAGRTETMVDSQACAASAALQVGDGGSASDLGLLPHTTSGVGLLFDGSGSATRVDVRGGATGVTSGGSSADDVVLANVLVTGDSGTGTGINGGDAAWTVERSTLVQVGAPVGIAVVASTASSVSITESLVVGWGWGVFADSQPCTLSRTFLWDIDPGGELWDTSTEAAGLPNHADLDPLFVDDSDHLLGDFHLQSTAGEWDGGAFVVGATDSPAVDAGHHEVSLEAAEADWACNLPNLGAYGGTEEASRSWWGVCPVWDATAGQGFCSLVEAAASLVAHGHQLQLRDGELDGGSDPDFYRGASVESAPGATVDLYSRATTFLQEYPANGSVLALSDLTLWPASCALDARTSHSMDWVLEDVAIRSGLGLNVRTGGGNSGNLISLQLTDVRVGTVEDPLPDRAIQVAASKDVSIWIDDVEAYSVGDFLYVDPGFPGSYEITIQSSDLQTEGSGVLRQGTDGSVDITLQSSVLLHGEAGLEVRDASDSLEVTNTLIVGCSSAQVGIWSAAADVHIENSTVMFSPLGLEFNGNAPVEVINSAFGHTTIAAHEGVNQTPSPGAIQYSAFWANSLDADFTLDPTNLTPCDPGFPPASWPIDPAAGAMIESRSRDLPRLSGRRPPTGGPEDRCFEFVPPPALGVRAQVQDPLRVLFGPRDTGALEPEVDHSADRGLDRAATVGQAGLSERRVAEPFAVPVEVRQVRLQRRFAVLAPLLA